LQRTFQTPVAYRQTEGAEASGIATMLINMYPWLCFCDGGFSCNLLGLLNLWQRPAKPAKVLAYFYGTKMRW